MRAGQLYFVVLPSVVRTAKTASSSIRTQDTSLSNGVSRWWPKMRNFRPRSRDSETEDRSMSAHCSRCIIQSINPRLFQTEVHS